MHLRQAIDRFGEQLGAGVRHLVPALERGRVLQAEIGREVDDLDVRPDELARLRHRDPVRGGEKDDVAALKVGLGGIGVTQAGQARDPAQAGEHVGHRHARFLARGDGAQLRLRMPGEQAHQLHSGIACSADDTDLDHGLWSSGWDSTIAPGAL